MTTPRLIPAAGSPMFAAAEFVHGVPHLLRGNEHDGGRFVGCGVQLGNGHLSVAESLQNTLERLASRDAALGRGNRIVEIFEFVGHRRPLFRIGRFGATVATARQQQQERDGLSRR
jgi:hypothetical protein